MTLARPLSEAIRAHVKPGMHVHFASTPSRSNAAVRELARAFRGTAPGFTLSASGFHSTMHLLARLALGRTYLACFFGDNYPVPRPNRLYDGVAAAGGVIQHWSLLSYVEALRAGAMGNGWAPARMLEGTDVGQSLADAGAFVELDLPGQGRLGLVRALRPDVTFVHAPLADPDGNAVFSAPYCEGFWSANGARRGVIVTAEKLVSPGELAAFRDSMPLSRHKVLAVCPAPRGAHPQPLFVEPRFGPLGYADDFDQYRLWRKLATDDALFARFTERVLDAPDGEQGYRRFLEEQQGQGGASSEGGEEFARQGEITLVLAARCIRECVLERGYRTIIAGIGQSFFAARLAKLWLDEQGVSVDVIVETGLVGIACGADGHEFPLSHKNIEQAQRRSGAEDALGVLATGSDNRCLGVIGSAQVDGDGSINSTRLEKQALVGPGGATDIAALCDEVVVLSRSRQGRLVRKVDHVTSVGHKVRHVVTDVCVFAREGPGRPWSLKELYPAWGGVSLQTALSRLRELCAWEYDEGGVRCYAAPLSTRELMSVHRMARSDETWTREAAGGGGAAGA